MTLVFILFENLAIPLMNFWHTRHFCRNFPCSIKVCPFLIIAICQDFPLCHLIWGFAKSLIDSCPIPQFLQYAIFVKIANCQLLDFWWIVAKFANFAKCDFRKTHNYRHASFVKFGLFVNNGKAKKLKERIHHFPIFHNRPCFAWAVFNFSWDELYLRGIKCKGYEKILRGKQSLLWKMWKWRMRSKKSRFLLYATSTIPIMHLIYSQNFA